MSDRTASDKQDQEVIRRVGAGERSAFRGLILRYQGPLYAFVMRMVRRPAVAEELVQEAFVRAFRAAPRYEPTAAVSTWLFHIAARLALNELAKSHYRHEISGDLPEDMAEGSSPLEAMERRELSRSIEEALAQLPPQQRAAVVLARFEDMSYRDIGNVLGVSEASVDGLLQRARQTLVRLLGPALKDDRRN